MDEKDLVSGTLPDEPTFDKRRAAHKAEAKKERQDAYNKLPEGLKAIAEFADELSGFYFGPDFPKLERE